MKLSIQIADDHFGEFSIFNDGTIQIDFLENGEVISSVIQKECEKEYLLKFLKQSIKILEE